MKVTPSNHVEGEDKPCVYGYFGEIPLMQSSLSCQLNDMLCDINHKINNNRTGEIVINRDNDIYFENHQKNYIIAARSILTDQGTKYLGKSVIGDNVSYFCIIKLDKFEDKESTIFTNVTDLYKAILEFNQL